MSVAVYSTVEQTPFDFWGSPVITADDGTLVCPGFVGPTYAKNPWDYVYLGIPSTNPFTPGLAEVHVSKGRAIDKKKAAGNDGERITLHGLNAADVEIRLTIWTPEQLKALDGLWPVLFPQPGKAAPGPFDAQHPALKRHGVKSLQFISGDGPNPGPGRTRIFVMKAVEFTAPPKAKKKVTTTPVASKGSLLDPGAVPTPGSSQANRGP